MASELICVCLYKLGASVGGGGRAIQHRGHRLPVGHPPGPGAQPSRYRCSALLAPTPLLSWTLSSLPIPPSNPVPGRKRTWFAPSWLSSVAGCREAWCPTRCLSCRMQLCAAALCGVLSRDEESVMLCQDMMVKNNIHRLLSHQCIEIYLSSTYFKVVFHSTVLMMLHMQCTGVSMFENMFTPSMFGANCWKIWCISLHSYVYIWRLAQQHELKTNLV